MSCDHELANEWVRCSGRNASYITIDNKILTKQTVYLMTTMNFNKRARAKLVSASSNLAGEIGLRCGWLLSVANAMLIITKHIDFYAADQVEAKHTSGEEVEAEQ